MLSERSCCASTGSVEPRRKRCADAAKHPRQTPAAALWTPRNRTAAAVLTGLPPGPALLPATPSGAPCWAATQTCPHPRAEIPRRCAAATTINAAAAASMEARTREQRRARKRAAYRAAARTCLDRCGGATRKDRGRPAPPVRGPPPRAERFAALCRPTASAPSALGWASPPHGPKGHSPLAALRAALGRATAARFANRSHLRARRCRVTARGLQPLTRRAAARTCS